MTEPDELLNRVRSGDRRAASELVRRELPRVFALCQRLCRAPADAEDLCQDVFVRAVRALNAFKGEASLSTWLHRITVNTWKNRVRYEKRRYQTRHISLSVEEEGDCSVIDPADPGTSPEDRAALADDHARILLALETLEPEDRSVIVLRDMEERSYEEMAEMLEMNMGTLKSKLSRARERLRDAFQRRGGSPIE